MFYERGKVYKAIGIKTANSVKRILGLYLCVNFITLGPGEVQYIGGGNSQDRSFANVPKPESVPRDVLLRILFVF